MSTPWRHFWCLFNSGYKHFQLFLGIELSEQTNKQQQQQQPQQQQQSQQKYVGRHEAAEAVVVFAASFEIEFKTPTLRRHTKNRDS